MSRSYRIFLITLLIVCLVVAGACVALHLTIPQAAPEDSTLEHPPEQSPQTPDPAPSPAGPQEPADPEPDTPDAPGGEPAAPATPQEQAQAQLDSMTLREKIYQMMFVTPEWLTGYDRVTAAGDVTKQAIKTYPVGGIIYFASNLQDREQTQQMIANTQSYSKIPLFIGADEEGGIVSRLGSNPEMGVTAFPNMADYGAAGDAEAVYDVGATLGRELKELGFNLDFAPVCDIVTNPDNTEIGPRSFSSDPQVAAAMVSKLVQGLQDNGVASSLKHFPGHGSTSADSHSGLSSTDRTLDELRQAELIPFEAGIQAGAQFVMVSHMSVPSITGDNTPCDLSPAIISLLRDELEYTGIVITDSQAMGAITQYYTASEAALAAVNAGVDMILMPNHLEEAAVSLMRAVEDGQIPESRIDESVLRILTAKYALGIAQ